MLCENTLIKRNNIQQKEDKGRTFRVNKYNQIFATFWNEKCYYEISGRHQILEVDHSIRTGLVKEKNIQFVSVDKKTCNAKLT